MHQIDPVTGLLNLIHFLDLFSGPDLLKIRGEIEDMATVRDQLSHVLLRAPERRVAELNLDVDKLDRWLGVAQSMCEVGKAYDPSGRVDNLTVFIADPLKAVAKDRPEWRGKVGEWQRFVREGVNLVDVEGAHYTVLSPEYVRGFTKHFKQAMAAGRATSKPFEHMGVLYPPVCSPLSLRKLADFKPNPDDIVVATYPKSGTTWMLHILYQLKSKGRMDFEKITDCCPWLDTLQAWDGIVDGAVGEQRIIKTHSPPDLSDRRGGQVHLPGAASLPGGALVLQARLQLPLHRHFRRILLQVRRGRRHLWVVVRARETLDVESKRPKL